MLLPIFLFKYTAIDISIQAVPKNREHGATTDSWGLNKSIGPIYFPIYENPTSFLKTFDFLNNTKMSNECLI